MGLPAEGALSRLLDTDPSKLVVAFEFRLEAKEATVYISAPEGQRNFARLEQWIEAHPELHARFIAALALAGFPERPRTISVGEGKVTISLDES